MSDQQSPSRAASRMNADAITAMGRRDLAAARDLLSQAVEIQPDYEAAWLNLAGVQRALNDQNAALQSAEQAIRINPRSFMGLLLKGSLLEAAGNESAAALTYGAAEVVAPPLHTLSPSTRKALDHAHAVNDRFAQQVYREVKTKVDDLIGGDTGSEARRIYRFLDISVGRSPRPDPGLPQFFQNPSRFFYPDLPYVEFFDRSLFPWMKEIEAQTSTVLEELTAVIEEEFPPYIQYADGLPIDQWGELNHSKRWGAFHLIANGAGLEENRRKCPRTSELINAAPQPQIPGNAPNAMFSRLSPRTQIPPHCGVANIRLVFHLPLIIPEGCGFRVGSVTRPWKPGESWVFDDTIEHEAWNGSDRERSIFMMDVWHPMLSEMERTCISTIIAGILDFGSSDSEMAI